ncbi:unnamed protein product [Allacma fusca]|uniref:Uncharacterized protein n=1 Tax=Allacma fusca TaxID=39272 RepID=A0A8J2P0H9_9HEXA|nr:unnamed protein product [Allacma fusca]
MKYLYQKKFETKYKALHQILQFCILIIATSPANCQPVSETVKVTTIDLQDLLPSLKNCFIRIFEQNVTFDYSTLTIPFVLTNVNSYYKCGNSYECELSGYGQPDNQIENILVLKMSSIKCFVGVILIYANPDQFYYNSIKLTGYIHSLRAILSNEYSLRYTHKVWKDTVNEKILRISPRIYFVYTNQDLYLHHLDDSLVEALRVHEDVFTYFRIGYTEALEISNRASSYPNQLYYINYNEFCKQTDALECPYLQDLSIYESLTSCYKNKIMNGRNFFAWAVDEIKKNISTICQLFPVTGEESFSVIKATKIFLREDFNQTLIRDFCFTSKEKTDTSYCFQAHFISTSTLSEGFQFYQVSYENDFNFITSDGIFQVTNTVKDYLTPFGAAVRWSFLVTFIVIALIVTGLTIEHEMFSHELLNSFFYIFGILLEQGTNLPAFTSAKSELATAGKIVLFFFIPSAMILGTFYKSFLKSDFSIPVPYKTSWNDLKQLVDADFEVFVPMEDCNVDINWNNFQINKNTEFCKPDHLDIWEAAMCQEHLQKQKYASFLQAVMLHETDLAAPNNGSIPKYYSTILDLVSQTTFVCLEDFPAFVRTNLSKSKTAFVVTRSEVNHYWSIIQELEVTVTRFAHNFGSNDSLLKKSKGFYISSTGDENYNWVHKRMNVLLSSGIYGVWEKWEQVRNGNLGFRFKSLVGPAKVLVMTDFELVFIGWCILLTVGFLAFAIIEVNLGLATYCKKRKFIMI